jgi:hypothetical protein
MFRRAKQAKVIEHKRAEYLTHDNQSHDGRNAEARNHDDARADEHYSKDAARPRNQGRACGRSEVKNGSRRITSSTANAIVPPI